MICSHDYLVPAALQELDYFEVGKLFELGCGNGSLTNVFSRYGWDITSVDPSSEGLAQANSRYPILKLFPRSDYDDLPVQYERFFMVTSLEETKYVYFPRKYAATLVDLLPLVWATIVSTPHSYLRKLIMALTIKMDTCFTALMDHGQIKFLFIKILSQLLNEACFVDICFYRVGRMPPLAKSMVAIARNP